MILVMLLSMVMTMMVMTMKVLGHLHECKDHMEDGVYAREDVPRTALYRHLGQAHAL